MDAIASEIEEKTGQRPEIERAEADAGLSHIRELKGEQRLLDWKAADA